MAQRKTRWQRPSLWIGLGLAVALILSAIPSGVGGVLMMTGVIGLGTGLYTLATRRPSWLVLGSRKAGAILAAGALVLTFGGASVAAVGTSDAVNGPTAGAPAPPRLATPAVPTPEDVVAATPTASPTPTATAAPTATVTPTTTPHASAPAAGTALALLATLPVKGRAPKTGYDRSVVFGPAWKDVDRNGCDTRNDVLHRDLKSITTRSGTHDCIVLTGVLHDPYTATSIDFQRGQTTSTAVQIDHVVALMNAWQSGAQQLSQAQREALANDPLNLLAVDGPTNESKGAGDAATWLPPNKSFRCTYVARQITVKATYRLWVTSAERDAMRRVLSTCPTQKVATAGPVTVIPKAAAKPAPKPAAPKPAAPKPAAPKPAAPKPAAPKVVHPGAYCTPVGAKGVTVKGTAMACTSKAGDRARWRSAG